MGDEQNSSTEPKALAVVEKISGPTAEEAVQRLKESLEGRSERRFRHAIQSLDEIIRLATDNGKRNAAIMELDNEESFPPELGINNKFALTGFAVVNMITAAVMLICKASPMFFAFPGSLIFVGANIIGCIIIFGALDNSHRAIGTAAKVEEYCKARGFKTYVNWRHKKHSIQRAAHLVIEW
ncbi:MAG: hypothetical protein G01um101419_526 [Parcubacteria group bacterium Gr01-1014_19]|nr:MAG: hypothetical protein G01um101419_526 [Parcubacteria group bacterium Gr01-1014_19]